MCQQHHWGWKRLQRSLSPTCDSNTASKQQNIQKISPKIGQVSVPVGRAEPGPAQLVLPSLSPRQGTQVAAGGGCLKDTGDRNGIKEFGQGLGLSRHWNSHRMWMVKWLQDRQQKPKPPHFFLTETLWFIPSVVCESLKGFGLLHFLLLPLP